MEKYKFLLKSFQRLSTQPALHFRGLSRSAVCGSQYPKTYLPVTMDAEELQRPLLEDDIRRFQPIRAANSWELPAPEFDPVVEKMINRMMYGGRRDTSRLIMDRAFEHIKYIQIERYNKAKNELERRDIELNPVKVFNQAIQNCTPILGIQKSWRSGVYYNVPVPLTAKQAQFIAIRFLLEACRDKPGEVKFYNVLSQELIQAASGTGKAIRKKHELHRLCEQSKQYASLKY